MNMLDLRFKIDPVPASRPRVTRWGTYYGKKYKNYKDTMKELTQEQVQTYLQGLLFADMTFFVPMAKSWSKKRKEERLGRYCDNNADLDNYEKAILDSLTGVAFKDDCQIVKQSSRKIWALEGSTEIFIKEIADDIIIDNWE
jgi:Holliday junction resolvase RusA-like endonuclease